MLGFRVKLHAKIASIFSETEVFQLGLYRFPSVITLSGNATFHSFHTFSFRTPVTLAMGGENVGLKSQPTHSDPPFKLVIKSKHLFLF